MSPRVCETPSAAAAARQPDGGDAHSRPAQGARGDEAARLADDEVRPRAAHRPGQTPDAEAGVGDDDDRTDPQARVDHGGQGGAGLHQQRDPVALSHPDRGEARCEAAHPVVELPPAHPTRVRPREDMSMTAISSSSRRSSSPCQSGTKSGGAVRRRVRGGASRGAAWPRPAIEPEVVAEPRQHRIRVRTVFGDEVPRTFEAVHVGVRQPVDEVVEVAVAEDRVLGSPQHQRRHLELSNARRDPRRARNALVAESTGMSATNPPMPRRRAAERYGASVGISAWRHPAPARQASSVVSRNAVVVTVDGGQHAAGSRDPQRRGDRHAGGLVNRGVEQHHAGEAMPDDRWPSRGRRRRPSRDRGSRPAIEGRAPP